MKDQYKELELEVIEFDREDVIVTSNPDLNDENTPSGSEPWA